MHIIFLTSEFPDNQNTYGGIGTFVKFLAEKLVAQNVKVSVIGIYKNDESIEVNGIKVHKLKKSNWILGKFYHHNLKIQKKIKEINNYSPIDFIEGSELNFAFFPKKTSYKKVIRLHGGHHFFANELGKKTAFWRSYQEKKSFKKANYFIAVTNYVGNQTKKFLKFNFKFITIFNTVKLDAFYNSNPIKEIPFKLLFIGTVCEKKGVENLINAFYFIKQKFPEATLDIIGRDWSFKENASYTDYLKIIIKEKNISGIKFLGALPYDVIPSEIEKAQICVYPSLAESFGLTIIESMSMGKAIVASKIEPYKEIVGNSNSVLFHDVNSIEDIVDKISLLLTSQKRREQLSLKSRDYVINKFKIDKIIEQNLEFYKSIS
ncbi:glycosyltransferase family 4 protein [Polaribacter aquimarinus]|uniref:Glycosyl transferase family 1 domain-containing protein n=1 Tax=Polaribacter aquimarinus TaxID=2100726 RepID=A0A2U2J7I2_9FLAO|nr:glycosyltransferase family 4 protein [Polaribacter aquimarinus]PWG04284.1 hypothetical protein DIS07_12790 [Polaribacter aquimarinus]